MAGQGSVHSSMAQNTASATAGRNTVPGTANEQPVAPPLFTGAPRREYTPDAKRMKEPLATPELERARALFDQGNFAGARRGETGAALEGGLARGADGGGRPARPHGDRSGTA